MNDHPKNKCDLKKRIDRFLKREIERDALLQFLIESLKREVDVYIFGGLIRDIALHGIKSKKNDIDIVFVGSIHAISKVLANFDTMRNRFGGYRFHTKYWQIDLWEASASWAFTCGEKRFNSIDSLLETTITNWDSVLYDLNKGVVISKPNYLKDLRDGYLDVVLSKNPNEIGMFVKILRIISEEPVRELSPKALQTLSMCMAMYSAEDVSDYEAEHYNDLRINRVIYDYLKEHCTTEKLDLLPFELEKPSANLPLFA